MLLDCLPQKLHTLAVDPSSLGRTRARYATYATFFAGRRPGMVRRLLKKIQFRDIYSYLLLVRREIQRLLDKERSLIR